MSLERKQGLIEPGHPGLSGMRQCALLSASRSGFHCQPAGETAANLAAMRLIDAPFLEAPWYGSPQISRHLRREATSSGASGCDG